MRGCVAPLRRRLFGILCCAIALGRAGMSHGADAPTLQKARVAIHPEKPGAAIPANFPGFSYERAQPAREHLQPTNSAVMNLFRNPGAGVLRISGGSQDSVGWPRTEMNPPANEPKNSKNKALVIGPVTVDNLGAFAKRAGWNAVYGLNLGANNPGMADEEAAYAPQAGGPMVPAFEIGNEPNLYPQNSNRPANYGYAQYRDEVEAYDRTILTRLPHAPPCGRRGP